MSYSFGGWERDLDRWLTTDPRDEVEPIYECDGCDDGIFDGDTYYKIGGKIYCEHCVESAKKTAEFVYPDRD